jgi:hypothetical protein
MVKKLFAGVSAESGGIEIVVFVARSVDDNDGVTPRTR